MRAVVGKIAGIGVGVIAMLLGFEGLVHGAGLYIADRGVRPLARGGAFVAGADDIGAIFYNPAGLVYAKRQGLVDIAIVPYSTSYTRKSRIQQADPNTGQLTGASWDRVSPTVRGSGQIVPIPTLGISYDFGLKNAAFALGMWIPYAAVSHYPKMVAGEPNPGRYMLISLKGSAFAVPGIWAAYRIFPWLSVGAGFELLAGKYKSEGVMSACLPDRWMCAPEDPQYDSANQMDVAPVLAPSGNLGLVVHPHQNWRIGASFQLPFWVDAPSKSVSRVPQAAVFQNAHQQGDSASVRMTFPWVARVGVETLWETFRVELAVVLEGWSIHKSIDVIPHGIVLKDVFTLADDYRIMPQKIPRNFKNSWSFRLGGEGFIKMGKQQIDVRAGAMYETSAVPTPYMSTLTIDSNKFIGSLGAGVHLGKKVRLDAVVAQTFAPSVHVATSEARIELPSSVLANKADPAVRDYVNGGTYKASATIIGLGVAYNY